MSEARHTVSSSVLNKVNFVGAFVLIGAEKLNLVFVAGLLVALLLKPDVVPDDGLGVVVVGGAALDAGATLEKEGRVR